MRTAALPKPNDAFLTMTGYSRDDLARGLLRWTDMIPVEYRELDLRVAREFAPDGFCPPYEKAFLAKDGRSIPILIGAARLPRTETEFVCFVLDLTELKRAQGVLLDSGRRLALAVKAGRSGTFEWHAGTNTNVWSDELLALYGLRADDFGGRYEDWIACLLPEDREAGEAAVRRSLETGEFALEFRIRRRDTGDIRWMHGPGEVCFDEAGKPRRMIGINVDITEQKLAEEAFAQLNQELEQRVRERTEELQAVNQELEAFTYSVSHDLRAPVRHITGFTNLLKVRGASRLDEQDRHYLEHVIRRPDGPSHRPFVGVLAVESSGHDHGARAVTRPDRKRAA